MLGHKNTCSLSPRALSKATGTGELFLPLIKSAKNRVKKVSRSKEQNKIKRPINYMEHTLGNYYSGKILGATSQSTDREGVAVRERCLHYTCNAHSLRTTDQDI